MPQFIAYVGAYLMLETTAVAIGAFLLSNAALVATGAMLIGSLAYGAAQASKARKQAKEQYNAAQVDRMANVVSSKAPRELVMGRVRKAGTIFYRASTGKDQQELYVAIALAAHEVDAVEGYYLNDELVTLNGSGEVVDEPYSITTRVSASSGTYPTNAVAGSITESYNNAEWGTGELLGYNYQVDEVTATLSVTLHRGEAGQTANAALMAAFPTEWLAANVVQGVAYLVIKATYNETAFPSGFPLVTAVLRGAKLYDPRTGLTVWSENPALMMRHVYLHPSFGKATSVTADEEARIIAAANACDAATTYTVAGVAQPSRALYKAAIVLPYGASAASAFDDLSQAMGGAWAFAGGELHMKAGVYTAPVMSLTEADLAVTVRDGDSETQRPIGISVHRDRASKFNTVKASIWDAGQDYKQTALTALTSAALVTRDGAELIQEVAFPAIGYAPQAQHIAGIMMRDARDALTVELPFKLRAYPLELFDVITLTIERYGWTNKQFVILSRTWTSDGAISLTMKETAAAITQMDAGFLAQGFAPNTNLPKPWVIQSVGALTVASGTAQLIKQADGTIVSRMKVSWPQVTDRAVQQNGKIEVQYRRADGIGTWIGLTAAGDDTQITAEAVEDGVYYLVRARARTTLSVGSWNLQVLHQVLGKEALPANVAGLAITTGAAGITLSWTANPELDYKHTEIRQGTSWAAGTVLFRGAANTWTWPRPPSATYTFWVKHFDTSGWESFTAAGFTGAYVLPDVDNSAIVVGGRNLLQNSAVERTGGNEYLLYANLSPVFDAHGLGEYTFSFDLKAAVAGNINVYVEDRDASLREYQYTYGGVSATTGYQRFSKTVTVTSLTPGANHTSLAFYGVYGTGRIPSVKNVKIEKGNKATDWTPASEDVDAGIANAATTSTWAGVSSRPADAALLNSYITMSATGVLSGGGGGSVQTIPTLDNDREGNPAPNVFAIGTTRQFKHAAAIGLNDGNGYWCTLETIIQFPSGGGGYPGYQYCYQHSKTWRRRAAQDAGTSWTAWVQDLDREAYTGALNADVTSQNTAAGIANQGALATLSAVNTQQIINDAVSKTVLAYTAAAIGPIGSGSYTEVQSITTTFVGGPVEIYAQVNPNVISGSMTIFLDDDPLVIVVIAGVESLITPIQTVYTLTAGSHRISLKVAGTSGSGLFGSNTTPTVSARVLRTREYKK